MTTNQTIDGVPRELRSVLAMILNALDRDAAEGKAVRGEMAQELRALLDAPAYPNRLCHIDYTAHPYICGCLKGDEEAQKRFDEHQGKADQPQGGPVAYRCRHSATEPWFFSDKPGYWEWQALYAEQPAPVSSTSDKYKAELYDEVWQKARDMGFGNVTDALMKLEKQPAPVALKPFRDLPYGTKFRYQGSHEVWVRTQHNVIAAWPGKLVNPSRQSLCCFCHVDGDEDGNTLDTLVEVCDPEVVADGKARDV